MANSYAISKPMSHLTCFFNKVLTTALFTYHQNILILHINNNIMTLKIYVYDYLTKTVEIDTAIEIEQDMEVMEANHAVYRETFPNCQVNFVVDENNFIFSPPINMQKDEQACEEDRMSWNYYVSKWHGGRSLDSDSDYEDIAHSAFYSQTL